MPLLKFLFQFYHLFEDFFKPIKTRANLTRRVCYETLGGPGNSPVSGDAMYDGEYHSYYGAGEVVIK